MILRDLPLIFVMAGLALYGVLAGADFGAGIWQLGSGAGERGRAIRAHAHESMAPVWEANHVWLIFVLTVTWTCYPTVFASIASTLVVPLFLAALGIIVRGAAYALRSATVDAREQRRIDTVSALSSLLTPFALGTIIGAVASGRVPVGNAAGSMWSSWLNPTSLIAGAMAVVTAAYLAAVYLSADAERGSSPELTEAFRRRALGAGILAGALAVAGLLVIHGDAPRVSRRLLGGPGLPALIVSVAAGGATITALVLRRYWPARFGAALAVAAILAGWGLAQQPLLLPRLPIAVAAAPHDTLVAVVVAVLAGGALLFPSLALLFRLTLGGQLGEHGEEAGPAQGSPIPASPRRQLLGSLREALVVRGAIACLLVGIGFLNAADAGWAHAIGVAALLATVVLGFLAALPDELRAGSSEASSPASKG